MRSTSDNSRTRIFNFLVYIRPFVLRSRRRNPDVSWWSAFVVVILSREDKGEGWSFRRRRKRREGVLLPDDDNDDNNNNNNNDGRKRNSFIRRSGTRRDWTPTLTNANRNDLLQK